MRVLHLTTEYPPVIYGGLGTAVGGWVTASAQAGLTVGVLLVEGELVLDEPGYRHYYGGGVVRKALGERDLEVEERGVTDRRGIQFFQATWADALRAGLRVASRWRPDIIHLHTAMVWHVAQAIQRETSIPLVYHVHSVDRAEYEIGQEPSPWLAHSEAQEAAINAADRLIALSQDEADLLRMYYPTCRRRIRVVGNGIAKVPLRQHRSASDPIVLYSGRLVERKGIRELLAAIPRVLQVAPTTRFVVAGGPPNLTGEQVAGQWLGREHDHWRDRIQFTGWLTPSDLAQRYRDADILVVPSRYEPFGMVVLEGMAYGLAVVASRVGGPAEILEHGRTGLLFSPTDVDELTEALVNVVCNEETRRVLGRAAVEDVHRNWTWAKRVESMQSVYHDVVNDTVSVTGRTLPEEPYGRYGSAA